MNRQERITIDPKNLVGKPVARGTRIAVKFVVELLGQGWSEQQIPHNCPDLTHDDLLAWLHYAIGAFKSEPGNLAAP